MSDKTFQYYHALRNRLNEIFRELQESPQECKMGYWHTVPSILNAYREGDVSFERACALLQVVDDKVELKPVKSKLYCNTLDTDELMYRLTDMHRNLLDMVGHHPRFSPKLYTSVENMPEYIILNGYSVPVVLDVTLEPGEFYLIDKRVNALRK